MVVPTFEEIMKPLLDFASRNEELSLRDYNEYISKFFNLGEKDRSELLPSGRQLKLPNRISWAVKDLLMAGLLTRTAVGRYKITGRGMDVTKESPSVINRKFLRRYPEYRQFLERQKTPAESSKQVESELTPLEQIEASYKELKEATAKDILEQIKSSSWRFFELLVLDLLYKMGYGGSKDDVMHVGRSHDGGIDGIIKEDKLGLDAVYIQAKYRDSSNIGSDVVERFSGSMDRHGADKGVIITSSKFTSEAKEAFEKLRTKKHIVIIDGEKLVELMMENQVGVSVVNSFPIYKIDTDYFEENE